MNINSWIKIHENDFGSPFEKMFAINVLAKIAAIDLNTVSTQYPFKDLDGKNRYCDFAIQEGSIKIAIEIDGFDKQSTGQGMSHDDFVDWQRRQAALTANGWYVLRFANRDVSNEPDRCQRYIELLLRNQRSKIQHQASLAKSIDHLNHQLKITQDQSASGAKSNKLQSEINLLKNQLKLAQDAQPLNFNDESELRRLVSQLEKEKNELIYEHEKIKAEKNQLSAFNIQLDAQKRLLNKKNDKMKKAAWAIATTIGILVTAGVYVFNRNITSQKAQDVVYGNPVYQAQSPTPSTFQAPPQTTPPVNHQVSGERTLISRASCNSPIDWRLAKNHVNHLVAVNGIVEEYRYMQNGRGAPTWINLGGRYPATDRLTVVIWGDDRIKFGNALSEHLVGRKICVIGVVKMRDGTPQITLNWPRELILQ
jgi:very-short-patch-repair endonuclease